MENRLIEPGFSLFVQKNHIPDTYQDILLSWSAYILGIIHPAFSKKTLIGNFRFMKRRTFIVATAALGLAVAIPLLYKRYRISRWESLPPLIHPLVLSHFLDEEAIRKIGTTYRSLIPSEDSKKQLLQVLSPGDKSMNPTRVENSVDGHMLEKKIEQEFKAENVTIVNGWVLSVTEARQCALLSFS